MQTLDDKALRIILAVARRGSIRGAAEQLELAPSIVSRQIAETERAAGLALFERSNRGMGLTEAGQLVLDHAGRVLDDLDLLAEQLQQLRGIHQGRIRICAGEGFLADLIEHGLKPYRANNPAIRLSLETGSTREVMEITANGEADIGIAYNPFVDVRLRSLAIARQPLCLIVPPAFPLPDNGSICLRDCLAGPYALLNRGHGVTQLIERVAADQGLAVAPVMETTSIDALRRFVAAGLGVTFLPRFAVSTQLSRNALGVIALSDPLLAEASAHLLVQARRRLPPSVKHLAAWLALTMAAFST